MSKKICVVLTLLLVLSQYSYGQPGKDTVKFAFVSDLHFGKTDYNGEALYPDLWTGQALSGIAKRQPDIILVGGDLIESSDNATQYAQFDAAFKTSLPWYPMCGNHDIGTDTNSVTMKKINNWISRGYGRGTKNREYYGMVLKNIAAIYVLNTQAYISTDLIARSRADAQLAEADSFFTANKDIPIKILASHVPLFLKTRDEADNGYFDIKQVYRTKVLALMDKHKIKYYTAGHQHVMGSAMDKGIKVFFNTALSFQLGSGNTRGYYVFTVTKDTVIQKYYSLPTCNQFEIVTIPTKAGSVSFSPAKAFYDSAEVVKITAIPNKGWKFLKWNGSLSSSNITDTVLMVTDKTLQPIFVETTPTYNLINKARGNGQINLSPSGGAYDLNSVITVTANPAAGWEFIGWTGDKNGLTNPDTLKMSGDKEIKALFKMTAGGFFSLKPTDDSYVRGGLMYADKNYNSDTTVKILEGTSDLNRCRSYLKFDLSKIKGQVLSANLKMKVKTNGLPDGAPAKAHIYLVSNDSWKENTLTWKNIPTAETDAIDSCAMISKMDNDYSWDVTEKVKQELSKDSTISILLKDRSAGNKTINFYSKDNLESTPELIVVTDQATSVKGISRTLPQQFRLEQNYPNPFNPTTEIRYSLPMESSVKLKVFDVMGREVSTLVNNFQHAGEYNIAWDARDRDGHSLSSGTYICKLEAGSFTKSIKMVLLR